MNERLTDNEFHSKDKKERACYIQEPRLQAIYDKCFEYEDIDTNPTRLANIKKAFEIITRELNVEIEEDKGTYFLCITGWYIEIPKKEYALLKEVLYEKETS